jgi:hypothetical protein
VKNKRNRQLSESFIHLSFPFIHARPPWDIEEARNGSAEATPGGRGHGGSCRLIYVIALCCVVTGLSL